MVSKEFSEIPDDKENASWQKYLGSGAKTKVRAMVDLLKIVSEYVDQQTDVGELNVLIIDKKRLHAIYTVTNAWYKTGGGATEAFVTTFKEVCGFCENTPRRCFSHTDSPLYVHFVR